MWRRAAFISAVALLLLSGQTGAAIKTCNAARISAGDCAAGTQTILLYAIDTTALAELADEIAEIYGYPTIVCQSADVTAGRCSSGQIGSPVTTPETKNQFANRMLGEEIRRRIHNRRKRLAATAAESSAPLPGAIE